MTNVFVQREGSTEIALGSVAGKSFMLKFGRNPDVGATAETIWDVGDAYSYLAAATALKVSSSSAADTSAGTGARTVRLYGLGGDYAEITEDVTLSGQTAATTTAEFLRVYRMVVLTAGSGGKNAGVIYAGTGTVASGVPANKYAAISTGNNQTLMAVYTVPAGKTATLRRYYASAGEGKDATVKLFVRPFGGVFQLKHQLELYQNNFDFPFPDPLVIEEKSDIEIMATSSAVTVPISAGFDLLLTDNS